MKLSAALAALAGWNALSAFALPGNVTANSTMDTTGMFEKRSGWDDCVQRHHVYCCKLKLHSNGNLMTHNGEYGGSETCISTDEEKPCKVDDQYGNGPYCCSEVKPFGRKPKAKDWKCAKVGLD